VVDGEGEDPAADEVEVEVEAESEDDALAAAYAALGSLAPSTVEMHPELGSPSARAVVQHAPAAGAESITLRELNG